MLSSCRDRRGGKGVGASKPIPHYRYEPQSIIIINNNNNNTYNQRQINNNNVTVQNISTTTQQELNQTINNISNHTVNATINNTSVNLSVDNSIQNNHISQQIAQVLLNQEGDNLNINEGSMYMLNNIEINNMLISGITAEVNNAYNGIALCSETFNQIKQQLNNINLANNNSENDRGRGRGLRGHTMYNPVPKEPRESGVYQPNQPASQANNIYNTFRGTDFGGWNFLTIIGAIVVILFVLWILSWFIRN